MEPCQVRHQNDKYGEALADYEKRFQNNEEDMERLQKWKMALNQAANLSGYHFRKDEYEYEFITKIVKEISNKIYGNTILARAIYNFLPAALGSRRAQQEERCCNWTGGVNEEIVMKNLPGDLQRDIRRHWLKFVKKVQIFSLMDEPILDAICERLRQKLYIKGNLVLYDGNFVEEVVFIVRGKLESIGENGIRVPLSEGDVCGEELLTWCLTWDFEHTTGNKVCGKTGIPRQRLSSNRTVLCLTNVEAFSIRAADLEEVTKRFARFLRSPGVQEALRYESPYWRCVAAMRIQAAWRYKTKRPRCLAAKVQNESKLEDLRMCGLGLIHPYEIGFKGEGCPSFLNTTRAMSLRSVELIPSLQTQHNEDVGGFNYGNPNTAIRQLMAERNEGGKWRINGRKWF